MSTIGGVLVGMGGISLSSGGPPEWSFAVIAGIFLIGVKEVMEYYK